MKLTKLQQLLVGAVIIAALILVGEFLLFSEKKSTIRRLQGQISELNFQIQEAKRIKRHAKDLETEMNNLMAQLDRLKKILPVEFNKPKFLQDIRRYANENALEVVNFSNNKPVVDDVIVEHPFTFFTLGTYHDLGKFFAKLSNYPRILNIKGLNIEKNTEHPPYSLKAKFLVSVFTYNEPTEEQLKAQIEAKKMEMNKANAGR